MIAGALEIICGVDAGVVNPLLLPATQGEEKFDYIVIKYDDFQDVFDILFVRGNHVAEYVCIHHDLRAILGVKSVEMLLLACGMRCRVYLFSVSRQSYERFLRTFYCEPTLNVVIDRLSRNQISGLLMDSGCRNGILEVDRSGLPFPQIDLARFHSPEELLHEASRFRRGRIILYDLELNSAIRQRAEILQGGVAGSDTDLDSADLPGDAPLSAKGSEKDSAADPSTGSAPSPQVGTPASPPREEEEIVFLFRNVLKEFIEAVKLQYPTRLDRKMNDLLCRVFHCPAAFEPDLIVETNLAKVLTVIELGVELAWTRKRKLLKKRALEIIKNLYETHNELLRSHGVDARVQDCYRTLES